MSMAHRLIVQIDTFVYFAGLCIRLHSRMNTPTLLQRVNKNPHISDRAGAIVWEIVFLHIIRI